MAIRHIKGEAPFVIDRVPPPFIQRGPRSHALVSSGKGPIRFLYSEDAERFLLENLDADLLANWDYRIVPEGVL